MTLLFFVVVAAVALVAAFMMITARNLVHAVLWMVLNFASVAVLYITLSAPFVSMVQIAVYAGAIMVLFLFVVMLLGERQLTFQEQLAGQRVWAGVLAVVLFALLGVALLFGTPVGPAANAISVDQMGAENPQLVGSLLYTTYLVPFEITSILLLIAMVGAVVLAKRRLL
ncbi:MAG: NADH-quinone oxidoreductase subunit J [Anaerolineae bacterium]